MENSTHIIDQAIKQLHAYMDERHMRHTPERIEVLKAVCQIPGLFTIDELAAKMQEISSFRVSRVTIFNTLDLLERAHLVIRHTLAHAAQFECCVSPNPQICTVCNVCGRIKPVNNPELTQTLIELRVKLFTIRQSVLYLHGTCRTCLMLESKRRKAKEREAEQRKQDKQNIQQKQ